MALKILITGGTFDKEYDPLTGDLFFKNSHVLKMLEDARSRVDVKIRTLMMIDSLNMKDSHREIIHIKCKNSDEDKIVITHGTDTIEQTARYLGERIKDKTIILTGAMIPYAFGSHDGLFNMGSAMAFAQTLPHGVYVVMNGRHFPFDNVRKNKKTGEFETYPDEEGPGC